MRLKEMGQRYACHRRQSNELVRDDGRIHLLATAGTDSIIFFFFERLALLLVTLIKYYTHIYLFPRK